MYSDKLTARKDAEGKVYFSCAVCRSPAEDMRQGAKFLKVCIRCPLTLGEWDSKEERDAELDKFAKEFLARLEMQGEW